MQLTFFLSFIPPSPPLFFISCMIITNTSNSHRIIEFGKMRVTYPLLKVNPYIGKLRSKEIKKLTWVTKRISGGISFTSTLFLFFCYLKISGHLKIAHFLLPSSHSTLKYLFVLLACLSHPPRVITALFGYVAYGSDCVNHFWVLEYSNILPSWTPDYQI